MDLFEFLVRFQNMICDKISMIAVYKNGKKLFSYPIGIIPSAYHEAKIQHWSIDEKNGSLIVILEKDCDFDPFGM